MFFSKIRQRVKLPHFLILRRRTLSVFGAALGACAIFAAVNAPAFVSASSTARQLPIYCVERDQKVCSISFDAAWGADNTLAILEVLEKYGVKCTFFVVGNWADQYPEQAKAIVEHGHELQNHSNAHDHYNSLTSDRIIADVEKCNDKIEALTGVRPTLIRCPFGEYDDHVISAIRSLGMEPIQWDVETRARASNPCGTRIFGSLRAAAGAARLMHFRFPGRIRWLRGGPDMEFKHTHPTYEDARKREEKLRDTQRICLAAITALRMKEAQRSA